MKTNKCNFCKDGVKRFTTEKRINNTIIETIKDHKCEACSGKGVVAIDNLSYFIELNEIKFKIRLYKKCLKNVSNITDYEAGYEYIETKTCPECSGKGKRLLETKIEEDGKTNIYEFCEHCDGAGYLLDEEKTTDNIKHSIECLIIRKAELLDISRKDNEFLVNMSLNRNIKQYITETNYNICLQCKHFDKDYSCSLKCIHKDTREENNNFSAVSKSSQIWYDKNIDNILKLIKK